MDAAGKDRHNQSSSRNKEEQKRTDMCQPYSTNWKNALGAFERLDQLFSAPERASTDQHPSVETL